MGFSGIFDWSAQLRDLTDILLLANVEGFDRDSVLRDTGQIPLLNTLTGLFNEHWIIGRNDQ